jgi:hypothetical protein
MSNTGRLAKILMEGAESVEHPGALPSVVLVEATAHSGAAEQLDLHTESANCQIASKCADSFLALTGTSKAVISVVPVEETRALVV